MYYQDNEIHIISFSSSARVVFIKDAMPFDKFRYDENNRTLKPLKRMTKRLRKEYDFKEVTIKVKGNSKLIKRIIRTIRHTGIIIKSIDNM